MEQVQCFYDPDQKPLNENYFVCEECGEVFEIEEMVCVRGRGEYYVCLSCAGKIAFCCECCGEYYDYDYYNYLWTSDTGELICEECANRYFFVCEDCGKVYRYRHSCYCKGV